MRQIVLAESAGFCYGVRRAVELAKETAAKTGHCWMLGTSSTTPTWSRS